MITDESHLLHDNKIAACQWFHDLALDDGNISNGLSNLSASDDAMDQSHNYPQPVSLQDDEIDA